MADIDWQLVVKVTHVENNDYIAPCGSTLSFINYFNLPKIGKKFK